MLTFVVIKNIYLRVMSFVEEKNTTVVSQLLPDVKSYQATILPCCHRKDKDFVGLYD